MPFFQNPFDQEFQGVWVLGDRQYAPTFKVPPSRTRGDIWVSYFAEPYDLATNNTITINFAFDRDFKNYSSFSVNIAGATAGATTATEVVDALNDDTTFAEYFTASLDASSRGGTLVGPPYKVVIKSKRPKAAFRAYISNSSAEMELSFNRFAGVGELPEFFARHTIANRFTYTDSLNHLVMLGHFITANTVANPTVITSANHGLTTGDSILIVGSDSDPTIDGTHTVTVTSANTFTVVVNVTTAGTKGVFMTASQQSIITDAGFTPADMQEDYELLRGRSGIFNFQKITVDGDDRITQIIEYPAGAEAGDLARKINYTYTSSNEKPDTITEIPYVLRSGDLITP
jgi:hypothetical protein